METDIKRLILHVGMNKTGSSSIQKFLRDNAGILEEKGIHYPKPLHPHNRSIFSLVKAECKKPIQQKIRNYAAKSEAWYEMWLEDFSSNKNTTLVSSEQLLFFPREDIICLKKILAQHFDQVVVIGYVRDYDAFISSSIQERIKNGSKSIRMQLNALINNCAYRRLLTWIELCPDYEFRLRPFRREIFYKGDLISDFFYTCEIEIQDMERAPSPHANKSLGLYMVLLLERYNIRFPLMKEGRLNQERGLCHERLPVEVFSSIKDLPFRLDIGYSSEQTEKINGCIDKINRYMPPSGQIELLHMRTGELEKQLSTDIPKSFYIELFKSYSQYLHKILDRSEL